MENKFMRVEEVAEVLEVSTSFAYKVIRQLNDELKAKGFITIAGRINREYFYERLYHNGKVVISKRYDIFEVSKRIGHKSVKTTQDTYGHLFDEVQKSIANDLDGMRRR